MSPLSISIRCILWITLFSVCVLIVNGTRDGGRSPSRRWSSRYYSGRSCSSRSCPNSRFSSSRGYSSRSRSSSSFDRSSSRYGTSSSFRDESSFQNESSPPPDVESSSVNSSLSSSSGGDGNPFEYGNSSAICKHPCLNGGQCVSPGKCSGPTEYRGPSCELNILKCDIRKLANGTRIQWKCKHTKNETSCKVKCRPPAKFGWFASQSEFLYKCTSESGWTPSTIPQCIMPSGSAEKNVTETPKVQVTETPEEQVTEAPEEQVTETPEEQVAETP